jgi:molybdopterin-guanine dinucleotide biosynthesis protein A
MLLPVHGFVLAGGKSTRMGRDKALLKLGGQPLIKIAVAKLRTFCADVSSAGNRDDLAGYAAVVKEERTDAGPAAGVEAGLKASTQPWVLFVPVDAPLVPEAVLRSWAAAVLQEAEAGCGISFLIANRERQPAFCMLRRDAAMIVESALNRGERKLWDILAAIDEETTCGWLWAVDTVRFAGEQEPAASIVSDWFMNVNTPHDWQTAALHSVTDSDSFQ